MASPGGFSGSRRVLVLTRREGGDRGVMGEGMPGLNEAIKAAVRDWWNHWYQLPEGTPMPKHIEVLCDYIESQTGMRFSLEYGYWEPQ